MSDTNLLKLNSFTMQLSDQTSLELMITACNLPGFTLGQLELGRPVAKDKRPGDSLEYNDLSLTVLCDENMKAFKEIYYYLVLSANPETAELEINKNVFSGTLLLTSNKNNFKFKVRFYNMFFKSVGDLQFESTTTEGEPITFNCELGYSFWDFVDA